MANKVSAIVPIYNEEKTVKNVINVLISSPLVDEVICVNDGSTDNSQAVLKKFNSKIIVINLPKNHGKGFALARGIEKAIGEIVLFFDADLINFSEEYIELLVTTLKENPVKGVLGYPKPTEPGIIAELSKNNTGQRAYYKKYLLPHIDRIESSGFGVEVYLNSKFQKNEIIKIPLRKLNHVFKHEKYDFIPAMQEYLKMGTEIALEMGRQGKIIPEDFDTLEKIRRANDLGEIKKTIQQLRNQRIRRVMKRYLDRIPNLY